jgi:sugar phosphate isomerase/epimerase
MLDEALLSINQVTTLERWSLRQAIDGYARQGVRAIGVWRDKLDEIGAAAAAKLLRDAGMTVSAYCPGGLLTAPGEAAFRARLDDGRRMIDEAATIGARCAVMISGGLEDGSKDLAGARARCLEGLAELIPDARAAGVTLAIEPLHPMLCAARSVLTTLGMANDWCERLDGGAALGVVIDVYNIWWDPNLVAEIARAGPRIAAFQVCDWLAETTDLRLDRGMPGDGVIDIRAIRKLVEDAGYTGHREIEIFSARDWWRRDPDDVVRTIKARYQKAV